MAIKHKFIPVIIRLDEGQDEQELAEMVAAELGVTCISYIKMQIPEIRAKQKQAPPRGFGGIDGV